MPHANLRRQLQEARKALDAYQKYTTRRVAAGWLDAKTVAWHIRCQQDHIATLEALIVAEAREATRQLALPFGAENAVERSLFGMEL